MTKEMRSMVSRELADGIPPTAITADGIVRAGRRRVLGRRLGFAGAFVTGIAALTAGILALQPGMGAGLPAASPSASGSGSESPAPPPQEEQPSFPLPDLDWSTGYAWLSDGEPSANTQTAAVAEAIWNWVSAREGLELKRYDIFTGEFEPVTRETFPATTRDLENLTVETYEDGGFTTGAETGYSRPVYSLATYAGDESVYVWSFDGAENDASIGINFYPKGSYVEGPGPHLYPVPPSTWDPRYLVAGCEDYRYDSQGTTGKLADFTCAQSDGPNGERILTVECMINAESDWAQKTVSAVVYRPDGNAVVVHGAAFNPEGTEFHTGMGPVMTADEMVDMALAMPDVIVE